MRRRAGRSRRCSPARPTLDTYLEIHPGAGGTDSQDWAEMLLRMYRRWGERRKFKVEMIDYQDGDEAGIKSATLQFKGHNAYGWLKTKSGVHRLVRISPFDSNARRQTSFASVWVYPVVDDRIVIDVKETDCRSTPTAPGRRRAARQHDRFGGAHHAHSDRHRGHLPAGAFAAPEPGQGPGYAARQALRGRAEEARGQGHAEAASKTDIGWGHQIRSYVLQPYQLVKDLRTEYSTAPSEVLDGDLDPFMEASLAQRVYGTEVEVEDID